MRSIELMKFAIEAANYFEKNKTAESYASADYENKRLKYVATTGGMYYGKNTIVVFDGSVQQMVADTGVIKAMQEGAFVDVKYLKNVNLTPNKE